MILKSRVAVRVIINLISVFSLNVYAQGDFIIENKKGYFKQPFELVNDLVIVPVELNGRQLSFLLDTGVSSTILFSLSSELTESLKDPVVIYLKGLGSGKPVRALKSSNNTLKLGEAISKNQNIYILEGEILGISNRLGFAINGIIGYDFFKDFVVEFNYRSSFMKVFEARKYSYRKCSKCKELSLEFYDQKPYIKAEILLNNGQSRMVDLLVDSGSGDALWLFQDLEKGLDVPVRSFKDFLGYGLTGSIYGDRSRIKALYLEDLKLQDITVSFPDSVSLAAVNSFEERDGSVGAQVLKRFHSIFDYKSKKLTLKPNIDFNKAFEYNMSGVIIKHNGYRVVKSDARTKPEFNIQANQNEGEVAYSTTRQIVYSLEPSYEVAEIRPNSPADQSGLEIGDEVIALNGRPVYKYDLKEITEILSSEEGKIIRLEVIREGREVAIEFRLERIL